MVEFTLPKNSRIKKGQKYQAKEKGKLNKSFNNQYVESIILAE